MAWLKNRGVISNWWEFEQLPFTVREDCWLLMEAESIKQEREARMAKAEARRGGR